MRRLYREEYADFTVKHFQEELRRRRGYVLGYTVTASNPTFATRRQDASRALILHCVWCQGRHHDARGHTGYGTSAAITLGGGWAGKLILSRWSRTA